MTVRLSRPWMMVGVALFVVLLLVNLPARLLLWVMPSTISLSGVGGTIWNGRAARTAVVLDGRVVMLGVVEWRLRPWSLLVGRPTASVRSEWGSQTISSEVAVDWRGRLYAEDMSATLDVGWTRQLLPLYVQGVVHVDIEHAVFASQRLIRLDGQMYWEQAAWAARAGALPLGNYRVDWVTDDGGVRGDVATLSGGLNVEGSVVLDNTAYAVNVSLSGPAMENTGLQQAVGLFAVPDRDGYSVDLQGSL